MQSPSAETSSGSTSLMGAEQEPTRPGSLRAISSSPAREHSLSPSPLVDFIEDSPLALTTVNNPTPLYASDPVNLVPNNLVPNNLVANNLVANAPSEKPVSAFTRPGELINLQATSDMTNLFTTPVTPMSADQNLSTAPVIIWYDHEIIIEYPQAMVTPQALKRSIARLLLSPDRLPAEELLSLKPIKSQEVPALYLKVRAQNGKAIRYPADAYAYVDYLLQHQSEVVGDEYEQFTLVHIPITKRHLPNPVQKYQHWVQAYADRFNVSQDIVFAIMEVESAFNPKAVSKSEALGLMQVQAHTAGKDVYELVDRKPGMPGRAELFDPQNNIRMGVAYLGLLNHDYLKNVSNPKSKEMLAISSYNGGLSTVLRLFGDTPEKALAHINRLHPQQVYRTLRYDHPSDETRNYIDKVMHAKNRYTALLDLRV
jgi:membrane-bound lytic murein transglycosylase C